MVISLNRLTIHFMIFLALFFLILIELNGEELNLNLSQFSISNNSSDEAALKRLFKSSITSSGTTLQRRICYFANWVNKFEFRKNKSLILTFYFL